MNELKVFNFNGSNVQTILIEDEPYFVGKEVADILGYKNGSRDINRHVDDEDKLKYQIGTSGQNRTQIIINESGLYSLILGSDLPSAKEFKRWVTKEVLPTIRKHGAYMTEQKIAEIYQDPRKMAELFNQLADETEARKKLEAEKKANQPKIIFADAVATSETSILIGELAKILRQNGVDVGQKRLFEWMRQKGYLVKRKGTEYNMPTQRAMDLGLFEIKESTHQSSNGSIKISKTTKVTGKGQQYFINKFMKMYNLLEV